MGGRGAASGFSDSGKKYGSEYKTVAQFGNVKVVAIKNGSVTAPMETMTPGRVYATLDKDNNVKHITFYDAEGERSVQLDVRGHTHQGMEKHAHMGYTHEEYGTRAPNTKEQKMIDSILTSWERKRKKLGL